MVSITRISHFGLRSETKIYNNRTIQLFVLRHGNTSYGMVVKFWDNASINVVTAIVRRLKSDLVVFMLTLLYEHSNNLVVIKNIF